MSGHYEATLDVFSADFDKLSLEYSTEFEQLELDEVVVGAIAPFVSLSTVHATCPTDPIHKIPCP